jgi:hypothetical protein
MNSISIAVTSLLCTQEPYTNVDECTTTYIASSTSYEYTQKHVHLYLLLDFTLHMANAISIIIYSFTNLTERTIEKGWVGIGTEPHDGEIVVITPPKGAPLPPFKGEHVHIPRLASEAEYLCQRKLLMVNGMHTTLGTNVI